MATTNQTSSTPPPQNGSILWTLWYRKGNNPHPLTLNFNLASQDWRVACERAKRHCEVMNYRFIHVAPFLTDLDKAENFLLNREGSILSAEGAKA